METKESDVCLVKMRSKRPTVISTDLPFAEPTKKCEYLRNTCPLICLNLKLKLFDHLLLGVSIIRKFPPDLVLP